MGPEGVRYRLRINDILERPDTKAPEGQTGFDLFLAGLHENVNDSVTQDEAIDMLSQHLMAKLVFARCLMGMHYRTQSGVTIHGWVPPSPVPSKF